MTKPTIWIQCKIALVRFVALTCFRLYVCKEILQEVLHLMWVNAPWFVQEPAFKERSVPIGMRLVYRAGQQTSQNEIYWTDANQNEHRMIVLASKGKTQTASSEVLPMTDIAGERRILSMKELYDTQESAYRYEGLSLSDMELNEWLAGWNLDEGPSFPERGNSSA